MCNFIREMQTAAIELGKTLLFIIKRYYTSDFENNQCRSRNNYLEKR